VYNYSLPASIDKQTAIGKLVDGWEVTLRLKSDEETRRIPIIALSAHAMVGDRESALEAGCDDYDTKPVEFQRLLEKIEALLSEGSAP